MGIGNTTTSSAVLAALTGNRAGAVTGRGGGLTDEGLAHKIEVIDKALDLHGLKKENDVIKVLSCVGGLDIAGMCGAYLGAAGCRIPVVIDGFYFNSGCPMCRKDMQECIRFFFSFPSLRGKRLSHSG